MTPLKTLYTSNLSFPKTRNKVQTKSCKLSRANVYTRSKTSKEKKGNTDDQLTALDKKMQKPRSFLQEIPQQLHSDDDDDVDDDET